MWGIFNLPLQVKYSFTAGSKCSSSCSQQNLSYRTYDSCPSASLPSVKCLIILKILLLTFKSLHNHNLHTSLIFPTSSLLRGLWDPPHLLILLFLLLAWPLWALAFSRVAPSLWSSHHSHSTDAHPASFPLLKEVPVLEEVIKGALRLLSFLFRGCRHFRKFRHYRSAVGLLSVTSLHRPLLDTDANTTCTSPSHNDIVLTS